MTNPNLTKRNVIIGKRADMTIVDFHAHWSGQHAKFAMTIPGAQRYIQCHVSKALWKSTTEMDDITGFVELEYGTNEAFTTAVSKMKNLEDLLVDEARFLGSWTGCSSIGTKNAPIPSQRRIIGILWTSGGVSAADFRISVEKYVKSLDAVATVNVEESLTKEDRKKPVLPHFDWPDWFLYIDPLPKANLADLTSQSGKLLTGLKALSKHGGAFLTRTEAKLMDGEQESPFWPQS